MTEIEALSAAYQALSTLPKEARPRVFAWLHDRLEYDDKQAKKTQRMLEMEHVHRSF